MRGRSLLLIFGAALAGACTPFALTPLQPQDTLADAVVDYVAGYCGQPARGREALSRELNQVTGGARVTIACAEDD